MKLSWAATATRRDGLAPGPGTAVAGAYPGGLREGVVIRYLLSESLEGERVEVSIWARGWGTHSR